MSGSLSLFFSFEYLCLESAGETTWPSFRLEAMPLVETCAWLCCWYTVFTELHTSLTPLPPELRGSKLIHGTGAGSILYTWAAGEDTSCPVAQCYTRESVHSACALLGALSRHAQLSEGHVSGFTRWFTGVDGCLYTEGAPFLHTCTG